MNYQSPYSISPAIVSLVAEVAEALGWLSVSSAGLCLRRVNRIRTIHGSLAIEGNTLSEEQITAILEGKRVFDLVKDFGTSESPKSTRSSTTHWCPGRPGHPAFRHNIASSLRLHTGLPYDWTPRSDAPLGSPLAPSTRRVSRVASRLPGTTRLRFALHGGQRKQVMAPLRALGLKDAKYFRQRYLEPGLKSGLLEIRQPESPRSPTQKYLLTEQGRQFVDTLEAHHD